MKRLFAFEIVAVIYTDQFLNCTMKKELKPEIRTYIKGRAALKLPPRNVCKALTDIYGSSIVSTMIVSRWMKKFKTWDIQYQRWSPCWTTKDISDKKSCCCCESTD